MTNWILRRFLETTQNLYRPYEEQRVLDQRMRCKPPKIGAKSKGALQVIQDLNVTWYNTGNMNVLDSRCSVLTSLQHLSGGPRNKFQVCRGTPDTNSKSNQIQI